jgi:GntP family gluconate:H+ symporter
LFPPHPGAAAAAGIIGVEYGKLMLTGIIIAIPAMIVGYLYAVYMGSKTPSVTAGEEETISNNPMKLPSATGAFLPVVVPVILIALRSFFVTGTSTGWVRMLSSLGDPVIALAIGVLLALNCIGPWEKKKINQYLQEAAEKAGGILVIIGAGGSFGAVLSATGIGQHLSEALPLASMGILFPFLLSFILKTAQGSSTVAIITAASIIQPLLPAMGFTTPDGKLLCVLSMGAGSMMISHANDAYFWVIARFEKLEMRDMLKVYSIATVLMGLTTLLMVYILSLLL